MRPSKMIAGFRDPWERPLRVAAPERLKKMNAQEKEGRLLVATWQGREEEIKKIHSSGKPAPRTDLIGMPKIDTTVKISGKAGRGKTKLVVTQFAKNDIYRFGTPLHKACLRGDVGLVRSMLTNVGGAKAVQLLDEKTEAGNTPLHHAATGGHVPCVEALLEVMSDIDVNVNRQGQRDEAKGVKMINASLAAIQCRNMFLSTPVDKAREGHQKAVLKLLQRWPDLLEMRVEMTRKVRQLVDEFEGKPKELETTKLRAILLDVSKMDVPRVKEDLVTRAKALLHKAEDMQGHY